MATPLNGSLLKGFEILSLITSERQEISASIVAKELAMNTATAHRFLLTLEEVGALVSYQRGQFRLGYRIEELGRLAEQSNPLAQMVQPIIEQASRTINESVMACRLGRQGPLCIAVAISEQPITVNIRVGTVLPLHASAQGKLWLAAMDEQERESWLKEYALTAISGNTIADKQALRQEFKQILEQGYSLNRGENEPDIGAVSVPVKNRAGKVILTLSAFGMLSRFDKPLIDRAILRLNSAAHEVIKALE